MKPDAPSANVAPAQSVPATPRDEIATFLAQRAGSDTNARRVAVSVAASCRDIEDALTPIVGTRGVAALLNRSVHLAGQTHVWLNEIKEGLHATVDLQALTALLARQSPATAAAGGGLLLHSFHELLASLIGASLTERLLRSVWIPFMSGRSLDSSP